MVSLAPLYFIRNSVAADSDNFNYLWCPAGVRGANSLDVGRALALGLLGYAQIALPGNGKELENVI